MNYRQKSILKESSRKEEVELNKLLISLELKKNVYLEAKKDYDELVFKVNNKRELLSELKEGTS